MFLRVIDEWYTEEDDGYRETMPVVHVAGRDGSWERHHIEIEGFRPYFLVTEQVWNHIGGELTDDDRVLDVTREDRRGRDETSISGEDLVRVVVRQPSDVGDLRELVEDPYEADVLFPVRFAVDLDIKQWIEVPDDVGDRRIDVEEVSLGLDDREIPELTPPPRICTYDIEVQQSTRGPPVVSKEGTEQAANPITAISAHDSYTDEYVVWVLMHDSWNAEDSKNVRESVSANVSVYANPSNVVGQFIEWVVDRDFDALSGWNASSFDHPYLINWALNEGLQSVYKLSPTREVYDMDGDGQWINSSLKGRLLVDLMDMYEKTTVHELDSKRLEDVAESEGVSVGKLSIEDEIDVPRDEPAIDYAWEHYPEVFVEYSLKDTQAAVAINRESKEEVNIL